VLCAVRAGALVDRAFAERSAHLGPEDRRLARELVYGVLRLRGRWDRLLARRVEGGLERLEPEVLDALRLGVHQLLELDRVPAYAAVDESVEIARAAAGPGAAGLVNAVLRRIAREGVRIADEFPDAGADPVGYLSTWGSHPRPLVERWVARWGPERAAALVEANNRVPPVALTPLGLSRDEALRRLAEAGISARAAPPASESVEIEPADLERALACVPAVVQDPAAALVVEYADLPADACVADLCAAPGGKALKLAVSCRRVVACDASRARLARLVENARRAGVARLAVVVADAGRPALRVADAVLLDVPCTGTGTFRRHPDARWRWSEDALVRLVAAQRRWLAAAAEIVRPGGWLVYATCSLEPEENEEQVDWFLSTRRDYVLEAPGRALPEGARTARGELFVWPPQWGTDGAFAARFRRREDAGG
jgi:16S rRNA (cytosine967-C5)-methyltransferase